MKNETNIITGIYNVEYKQLITDLAQLKALAEQFKASLNNSTSIRRESLNILLEGQLYVDSSIITDEDYRKYLNATFKNNIEASLGITAEEPIKVDDDKKQKVLENISYSLNELNRNSDWHNKLLFNIAEKNAELVTNLAKNESNVFNRAYKLAIVFAALAYILSLLHA